MRIWTGRRTRVAAPLTCLAIMSTSVAHGQPSADPRDRLTLALPDAAWAVELRTPRFTVQKDEVSSDGARRYVYAVHQDPDMALSVRLERAGGNTTPEECRRYAWDHLRTRSPFRMDDVAMSETKELAILEYRVKEFRGLPVEQQHLHGYLAKDEVCVDVSKVRSSAADRPRLGGVRHVSRSPPPPPSPALAPPPASRSSGLPSWMAR